MPPMPDGEPIGRAALYSINALSWQGILVGDPLYRPFAVSAEAQWARRKELPPATESYARIRRMRLLTAAGRGPEAIALGVAGQAQNPSLPLALTLAGLQLSAGDNAGSLRTLGVFTALRRIRPVDRPRGMFGGRVHGDQTQRHVAGVHEVVPAPGMNEYQVVGLHCRDVTLEARLPMPVDEHEELVRARVDLLTDLSARRDGHDDDLLVDPGQHFPAKSLVDPGRADDVDPVSCLGCHGTNPPPPRGGANGPEVP